MLWRNMGWYGRGTTPTWSLKEATEHSTKVPRLECVKELLSIFGVVNRMPKSKIACMQELVPHLLWMDLLPYRRKQNGID